ncbi:MAG: ribosome biogenesis factor YjgA [Pseudomonadota bacterium]
MEDEYQEKSRTRIKKEAEELQRIGETLIKLSSQQLEGLDLPDTLHTAIIDAQSIKSNIAARRHRQYIGALMRDVDPEPIRQALLQTRVDLSVESGMPDEVQVWVDRFLTGDSDSMEKFIRACPGLERQRFNQLLRNVKKEQASGKPSKSLKAIEQLIIKNLQLLK